MSENRILVKIKNDGNIIRYIPLIREYTKEPISVIKRKLQDNMPVVNCYYINNPEEMPNLLHLLKRLEGIGAKLEVIQELNKNKRYINMETVKNLIQRDQLIEQQIQELDDNKSKD